MNLHFRNKYLRFASQLLQKVASLPLFWLGILIPKSKTIWIFGNTFGYKDNPRYLYEYVLSDPGIRPVWISKQRRLSGPAGQWHYYLSVKGLYYQYRAGVACIATGFSDIAGFTLARTFIVQLWHGIPIKKLLLDSPETSPIPARFKLSNKLFYWMLRRNLQKYDLLTAVNEHNRACLSQAFGLHREKVAITGIPRHDIILSSPRKIAAGNCRILYAPTWRPSLDEAEKCIRTVLNPRCIEFFTRRKVEMDVSVHPLNSELAPLVRSFSGVTLYHGADINNDLSSYDILITDFSSIAFDFSVLNRPVIFICENLDKYDSQRGIYEYFLNIIRVEHVTTSEALIEKITELQANGFVPDSTFYTIRADGQARKKIVNEIKRHL